ncbi:MAG: hypothetical protein JSS27_11110 [Planctomycetes bacterium]|nr:hypothetical protein [Planctomycetota bacterium]
MSKTTLTNRYDVTTRDEVNQLAVGDRIEVTHEVKVGQQRWYTTTVGTVERIERRRQGLHYQRNFDDKAFCDLVVLRLDDSSLTTITFDEFSQLKVVSRAKS